jgi:hypothetical protein
VVTRPVSLTLRLRISDNDPVVTLRGREAWALMELKAAGERGCTPIDHPGPRWSGYVHDLRKLGIVIETIRERHGGPFAGEHARYVLRSHVVILNQEGTASPAKPSAIVRSIDHALSVEHREKPTSGRF